MSPYKIRNSKWNYNNSEKNNWKLSRSKIELFTSCPRCFYLNNKLGVKRPDTPPFSLNKAVDTLLKKEFDIHRAKNKQHPLQEKYGIDARPVEHKELDVWRDNFKGIQCEHRETGMTISGAIDDLWINSKGEYVVVDYKATSKQEEIIELDKEWQDSYKRQLEIYQWLLRQLGYKVSDTGYFVYCNGNADREAFDAKLEFDITLIPYKGDDRWVDGAIKDIYKLLNSAKLPDPASDCDYCAYRQSAMDVLKIK